jgi:hypothetical protein
MMQMACALFWCAAPCAISTSLASSPESPKSQGKIGRDLKMVGRMLLAQKLH